MVNLKLLGSEKEISQQKLTEQIGITQQRIHGYENGFFEPDIETLVSLANFFETFLKKLFLNPLTKKRGI